MPQSSQIRHLLHLFHYAFKRMFQDPEKLDLDILSSPSKILLLFRILIDIYSQLIDYLYFNYLIQLIYKYFIKYATYNLCQLFNTQNWCVKHPVAAVCIFIHSGSISVLNQSYTYTHQHFYKFLLSHTIKVSILSAERGRAGRQAGRQLMDWFGAASKFQSFYSLECLCAEHKHCVFESVCASNIKKISFFRECR